MGRYTTVQAYSDNNPKLIHVSYDQAKAKDSGDGNAGGKLVVEKTDQVMGSCAGAGSGEFHTYRAHRRTEMHRVAEIEEAARKEEATAKLQETIEKNRIECEERTRKKADKRKRKKKKREAAAKRIRVEETAKESTSGSAIVGSRENTSDDDAVDEFIYIPLAEQAASGGDGGAPAAFKNDGTFLEKVKGLAKGEGDTSCVVAFSSGDTVTVP